MDNSTSSSPAGQPKQVTPLRPGRRYVTSVVNRNSGEIIQIDSQLSRVKRMRDRVGAFCAYVRESGFTKFKMIMVTATYAAREDNLSAWEPQHISELVKEVRKFCKHQLIAYCWVAELQGRGEVHYHLLLFVQPGLTIPHPDKAGWWPYGMTRVEVAHSPGYVMKYAQKGLDNDAFFPRGLRLFAVWVSPECRSPLYTSWVRIKTLPPWLRDECRSVQSWPKRVPGGGWKYVDTWGEEWFKQSPYEFLRSLPYFSREAQAERDQGEAQRAALVACCVPGLVS